MSFLGKTTNVLKALGGIARGPIGRVAATTLLGPEGLVVYNDIVTAITSVEAMNHVAPAPAPSDVKLAQAVETWLSLEQDFLSKLQSCGKALAYDTAKLQKAMSDQVTAMNSMQEFQQTMKILDAPQVPKS